MHSYMFTHTHIYFSTGSNKLDVRLILGLTGYADADTNFEPYGSLIRKMVYGLLIFFHLSTIMWRIFVLFSLTYSFPSLDAYSITHQ